jgi:hypothetical protein
MQPHAAPPSFYQRDAETRRHAERQALAEWVAEKMVDAGDRLFITTGTTVAKTAELILRKKATHITTNSVPVAALFMRLVEDKEVAPYTTLIVCGGELRAATGMIAGQPKLDPTATLVYSPHGLTEKAVTGDRDVEQLRFLFNGLRHVIMPVSWAKLNRQGSDIVKHIGHWKKTECEIVITDTPHPSLGLEPEFVADGERLLGRLSEVLQDRLKIHRVPMPAAAV